MFFGLNLESEEREKCRVFRCRTAFKTTGLQGRTGGGGARNGLRLSRVDNLKASQMVVGGRVQGSVRLWEKRTD